MLNAKLTQEYRNARKTGELARWAILRARTVIAWEQTDGYVTSELWDETQSPDDNPIQSGHVRLRIVPDDCASIEDLEGDCFNPHVNPDIQESRLERERAKFIERCNNEGVWGLIGEYWDGKQWEHADSCFGFIGTDWQNSGHDVDIMRATLDAWERQKQANNDAKYRVNQDGAQFYCADKTGTLMFVWSAPSTVKDWDMVAATKAREQFDAFMTCYSIPYTMEGN